MSRQAAVALRDLITSRGVVPTEPLASFVKAHRTHSRYSDIPSEEARNTGDVEIGLRVAKGDVIDGDDWHVRMEVEVAEADVTRMRADSRAA